VDEVADALRGQARVTSCPLTAAALDRTAGAPRALAALRPHTGLSVLGLRAAGAAHRAALAGRAPGYARHLPTCGGDGDIDAAATAFVDLVPSLVDDLQPVQTNEPGRRAALEPAFAAVHERTGKPLRLLELGASAGLLLHRPRPDDLPVLSRRGCDAAPLDPRQPADRLHLLSFVWAGQLERFRRLEVALDEAALDPATVDRADAGDWLAAQLAGPRPGAATVVFHSVVWTYLGTPTREAINALLATAARAATDEAPLAYVRFEPEGTHAATRLTCWPGGDEQVVHRSGYHGEPVPA
jgi:hypothetical protein